MRTRFISWALIAVTSITLVGCAQREPVRFRMRSWGALRDVLHDGRTEGRIGIATILSDDTVGVGLTAGLHDEITIDGGKVLLASVSNGAPLLRRGDGHEQATLLLASDVSRWDRHSLPVIPNLRALEEEIRRIAQAAGLAPGAHGIPFRVEGEFGSLSLHVLDGSCPVAHPSGPPPWRAERVRATGTLVGFYVEGQEGRMTHRGERSHVHATADTSDQRVSGHVDDVAIEEGATLYLPARR
ncbi:MAG: hypothetical protein KDC38_16595 [Planctomycetes bacterium]|nr:hypothetical protein [Planctomycetota bacterium]